ncbi:MAG: 2-amino-4-hydroxy-6-hydroxymethyldihydropteridine diphosphokinase [Actinomycetales bacterium]|nr:2-amino-4-hydroxy-6-hydroxymethyldihydropteridine diphosphokinase [Actinomycetales bacterium]
MAAAVTAVLALGGNLGDRYQNIKGAIKALEATQGIEILTKSPLVESVALTEEGLDETKPAYLNGVVKVATTLKPKELLERIRSIETEFGRIRVERWGSRTLDIDIIVMGDELRSSKTLTIPHPRAFERSFVLVPWAMMEPTAILPGHGRVADLAAPLAHEVRVWQKPKKAKA